MDEYTTGQVAHAAGLSEKAVRMYADRGLLVAHREGADARRMLGADQVPRARLIRLLRGVGLSLGEVDLVLGATDAVGQFDELWSERRASLALSLEAGEYVRSVLADGPHLDLEVNLREVPGRLVLGSGREATLGELPRVLAEATESLFQVLRSVQVDLEGPPFVEYHERATEGFAARITAWVPVAELLRPPPGFVLRTDARHLECFVALDASGAEDQSRLVVIHDLLSFGRAAPGHVPVGDNREIYLPSWGTGETGPVMEVAVPVEPTH
ncbi:MerR family transcriptional regulator [Cellulosimicrobium sp. NPDC055967]|uniref:MerR family transcriptional regulator n=1 Tax=Cellulosimicrobium sp. NPDC055967 TaxID=3345670 RepID=UPI0035E073D7